MDPAPAAPTGRFAAARAKAQVFMPGLILVFTIAAAATFLSEHYNAPVMLFALLIGMAFHFLAEEPRTEAGVELSAKRLLKIGIALAGARVTLEQILSLGALPLILVPTLVIAVIGAGVLIARLAGKSTAFGVLTGGAVAICGASAALAISSVLPKSKSREGDTLFTVVTVTTLSTIAMVAYPIIYTALGFDPAQIGLLLGATIHDVAQVVGAGYAVSEDTGDVATYVKLLRVAMLPVVVVAIALMVRRGGAADGAAVFPWFAVGFAAILTANSLGLIPGPVRAGLQAVSSWLLVAAISALGVKTSMKTITELGAGSIVIVIAQTSLLFAIATLTVLIVH